MTTTSESLVTIVLLDEDDPAALLKHYAGEQQPQPCHIALDLRDGELKADYNGEPSGSNAVPASVWHGQVLWWGIPCVTARAANALMEEIKPLAERVMAGASIEWDGNNNVGRLTDAAAAAQEEILAAIDAAYDLEYVEEMDAADWWREGELPKELTAYTGDEQLQALADDAEEEAITAGEAAHTVLVDALEYLTERREEMREEIWGRLDDVVEELTEAKQAVRRVRLRRNELIRSIAKFGASARSIAPRARVSHTAVNRMITPTSKAEGSKPA